LRRIFIATDSIPPAWLAGHLKITIVRAEDHFSDPAALPTYNSHAVERFLERYFPTPGPWEKVAADINQPGFDEPVTLTTGG
jgi:hypothetical protein